MSDAAVLARLLAQVEGDGEAVVLRALVEEASEAGARRALGRLGLEDAKARRDMDELRELLSAWRDAKVTARKAFVGWVVRIFLALLLIGIAVKVGLAKLVTGG